MHLALLTAMLTTARHINFNKNKKKVHTENIDGESGSKVSEEP